MFGDIGIIAGIATAIVTVALGISYLIRWIYKRGQVSGKALAEREANRHDQVMAGARVAELEERLREVQTQLDALRSRRRPRSG